MVVPTTVCSVRIYEKCSDVYNTVYINFLSYSIHTYRYTAGTVFFYLYLVNARCLKPWEVPRAKAFRLKKYKKLKVVHLKNRVISGASTLLQDFTVFVG